MLKAEGIYKAYQSLEVIKGVDLEITKGEVVSIVGSSGAGKSTLLQILGTLDTGDKGIITLNDIEINKLKGNALADFRNQHIGFIFQFHNLLPEFNALENIMMPALIGGGKKNEAKKRALELLDFFNLTHRKNHKPNALSGGEQQRISVARALVNNPKIVFADEPSGNLDSENAEALHNTFFELRKELGQTFVIVTHNNHLAELADRKLTMKDGTII